MKRLVAIFCLIAFAAGCTPAQRGSPASGAGSSPGAASPGGRAQGGGVDVGNMQSASIPSTALVVSQPANWTAQTTRASLTLVGAGARLEFGASDLVLTSPNAYGIKAALDARGGGRENRIVRFNGLEGVRTDSATGGRPSAELYLVSEMRDFVRVRLSAENAEAMAAGERVLNTTRLLYRGVALGELVHTADFDWAWPAAYGFAAHCLRVSGNCGHSVETGFRQVEGRDGSNEIRMRIGLAGGDRGRIVDLGSETDVPFDRVRIEGQTLVSPGARTPLADVYVEFTPREQNVERTEAAIRPGRVYLVRTISWPDEDVLLKLRIDSLEPHRIRFTYQNLAAVPRATLQRQVDAINAYTRAVEMPREHGEVTLYNRGYFDAYPYASFNFQYGTSGNLFITRNGWDVMLDGEPGTGAHPRLQTAHAGQSLGSVVDLGAARTLESVGESDLPDFNAYDADRDRRSVEPIVGHTYLVWHLNFDGALVVGAMRVLQQTPLWTRFEWRRVAVRPAPHFQRWIPLPPSPAIREFALGEGTRYFLTSETLGEQGLYEEGMLERNRGERRMLIIDNRPYREINGFMAMPAGTSIEGVTLEQAEAVRGPVVNYLDEPPPGTVVVVRSENFYFKTVAVLEIRAGDAAAIRGRVRTLYRARTAFASVPQ